MEYCCMRFPYMGKMVYKKLDNQSTVRTKEASRGMANFLKNERFYFIKIIRKHVKSLDKFDESWREVLNKIPMDVLEELAVAVEKFFKAPLDRFFY